VEGTLISFAISQPDERLLTFFPRHYDSIKLSTIGPTISASTGIRVVDAGSEWKLEWLFHETVESNCVISSPNLFFSFNTTAVPQLSMHSCREVMGIVDLTHGVKIFKAFYNHFRSLDDGLSKEII
jgi:hypothetical protein